MYTFLSGHGWVPASVVGYGWRSLVELLGWFMYDILTKWLVRRDFWFTVLEPRIVGVQIYQKYASAFSAMSSTHLAIFPTLGIKWWYLEQGSVCSGDCLYDLMRLSVITPQEQLLELKAAKLWAKSSCILPFISPTHLRLSIKEAKFGNEGR